MSVFYCTSQQLRQRLRNVGEKIYRFINDIARYLNQSVSAGSW